MSYMAINIIRSLLFACIIAISTNSTFAQNASIKPDPTGFITKYDTSFRGIGPEVYYLPKPQQKIEVLVNEYKKLAPFNDSIKTAILFQELTKNFENTGNYNTIRLLITEDSLHTNNADQAIEQQIEAENYLLAIGFLNEFAKQHILQKNYNKAEILLNKALGIAHNQKDLDNENILQNNLFSLYLFTNNFAAAQQIAEEDLYNAKKEKSLVDQGRALVKLAQIDANKKSFSEAEQTIIRKAIPLFNKAKDYDNKINAWVKLAQSYTANNQYTQAQWFLIQAQELAELKNITKYNTTIEYILGYSKYYQDNLNISKKELAKARALAQANDHKYIELATVQMLGQISIKQNQIDDAQSYLDTYWNLRNKLF